MTNKELATIPSEETLALLRAEFPQDAGFVRSWLPRLSFKSQDVTEGKGKSMVVTTEAGTFLTEEQTEEIDPETGKKIWSKTELGKTIEATIVYQRKQLRMYDETTQKYASSPVYDTDDEVLPLFRDKEEIARGTASALQAKYMGVNKRTGKQQSDLEVNAILYVLYNGELYQLNLRGSSMYSFKSYVRTTLVPSVLTSFCSEEKENGSIAWNQMTFAPVRQLSADEVADVVERVRDIKQGIAMEKAAFTTQVVAVDDFGDPLNA